MTAWEIITWIVSVAAGSGLAGTVITLLVAKLKQAKLIQQLHLEDLLGTIGKTAVNYAEAWGRTVGAAGTKKLNVARDAFTKELERHGLKLDMGSVDRRLESVLNELQGLIDAKTALGDIDDLGGDT